MWALQPSQTFPSGAIPRENRQLPQPWCAGVSVLHSLWDAQHWTLGLSTPSISCRGVCPTAPGSALLRAPSSRDGQRQTRVSSGSLLILPRNGIVQNPCLNRDRKWEKSSRNCLYHSKRSGAWLWVNNSPRYFSPFCKGKSVPGFPRDDT